MKIELNVLLSLIFFMVFLTNSKGQRFDKSVLDKKVRVLDTSYKFKETIYVIDGIPFDNEDSTKIDSLLELKGLKYLLSIDILRDPFKSNNTFCRPIKDVVLVNFVHKQQIKKKRKLFKRVHEEFYNTQTILSLSTSKDLKAPVLYINNEVVNQSEAMQRINDLRFKKVYYIDYADNTDSLNQYKQDNRNIILRIWTKPR